ncbi:MAG: hypothetical protein ACRD4C_02720 [Candidatus Acidiferrales bacterium]
MLKHRRSKRLPLSISVQVYGRTPNNHPFRDIAETKFVSAHGGFLALSPAVNCGQTLLIVNSVTQEERECRVVYVDSAYQEKKGVAIEFAKPDRDFWHVYGQTVSLKPTRAAAFSESE